MGTVFSDWESYSDLLDRMWGDAASWRSGQSFEQLDGYIRLSCPELVGGDAVSAVGEQGFAALTEALAGVYSDKNAMAARIRFAALSRPAGEYGLPAEWADYFVSEGADGALVFCADRFAEPAAWQPVHPQSQQEHQESAVAQPALARDETSGLLYDARHWYLPDGATVVEPDQDNPGYACDAAGNLYHRGEPADPATALFDRGSGRWRRATGSGDYEYHHEADQVWERRGQQDMWLRRHEATGVWLPYDAPSQTWLSDGQWVPGERVGAAAPDPARGHSEPTGHSAPEEQQAETPVRAREDALRAAIEQVRAAGFTVDQVSDAELEKLFDQRVLELRGEMR